jgi:hypothetical protein
MSMTHRNLLPSLLSSTRGENPPAHSRRIVFVAVSSLYERGITVTTEKVSTSTRVMPRTRPTMRAFLVSEQTFSNGGSPSITTHGLSRNSDRNRSNACAGNSFAYRQAYNSEDFVIADLPR